MATVVVASVHLWNYTCIYSLQLNTSSLPLTILKINVYKYNFLI